KAVAKAKIQALQADLRRLAYDKLAAIREAWGSRFGEFMAGRGSLSSVLEDLRGWLDSERRWLDSEAALGNVKPTAALERHWVLTYLIDTVNKARYEAGRIPIQDYLQSRYARLEAEIWLIEAVRKEPLAPVVGILGRLGPLAYIEMSSALDTQ